MIDFISSMDGKEFKIFNIFTYALVIGLIILFVFLSVFSYVDPMLAIVLIIGDVLIFKTFQGLISISISDVLLNKLNLDKYEKLNELFYRKKDFFIFNLWNNIYWSNLSSLEFYKGNFKKSLDIINDLKEKRISKKIKINTIIFEALNYIFLGEDIDIDIYLKELGEIKTSNKNRKDIERLKENIKIYYDILLKKGASKSINEKVKTNMSSLFNIYLEMNKALNLDRNKRGETLAKELSKYTPKLYIVREGRKLLDK